MTRLFWIVLIINSMFCLDARGADAAEPLGEPALDPPTLRCLGVRWLVGGDDNANATVTVAYRKREGGGGGEWKAGLPLFRVEKGKHRAEKYGSKLEVPGGATLYAGSVVMLDPDAAYEIKLTLKDADGGSVEKVLAGRPRGEPRAPADAPVRHVVPGSGGGSGTAADPFKGLQAAHAAARPGDVFLLRAGTYQGTIDLSRSGEPDRPIVWRGEEAARVILDGGGPGGAKGSSRVIGASGVHDVYFENLTIRNADYGLVCHDSARLVVRACHIHRVDYGITGTRNAKDANRDWFIADNVIEGPSTWPRSKGIENARGVQVTGAGHVVCYNRIRNFADAIDTFNSVRCESIDFHNNEISECTDDGVEMDYSQRNVRCFENRFTNVYQGVSVQPVFGGPVYVFRNALVNVVAEPFKIHNSPSGALFIHNTVVKKGPPMLVYTREPASNLVMRNNLFVGTSGNFAWECTPKMTGCDFDYDGFAGAGPFPMFLKWNGKRYGSFEEMVARAPIERHAALLDAKTLFASGAEPPEDESARQTAVDLRPSAKAPGIFGGIYLPNVGETDVGARPALGAYEPGAPLPHYGPREGK
jgi:hypothetical protein